MLDLNFYNSMIEKYKGTEEAEELKKQTMSILSDYCGKFLFARAKEDQTTRLFIDRLDEYKQIKTKDGWWDIFTITKCPHDKGLYVCGITDCKLDKDGYAIIEVYPYFKIEEQDFTNYPRAIAVLFYLKPFIDGYEFQGEECNFEAMYEKYRNLLPSAMTPETDDFYYSTLKNAIFNSIIYEDISLKDLDNVLGEKTSRELLIEDIFNRAETYYRDKYPEFYKRICKTKLEDYPLYFEGATLTEARNDQMDFLISDGEYMYSNMMKEGKITEITEDPIQKYELVLSYYKELHAKQKAERAAARKAKKAAKKKSDN